MVIHRKPQRVLTSHQYDVDGNYTPSVYVFTPNYSEEISEFRTPIENGWFNRLRHLLELPTDGGRNRRGNRNNT